MNQDSFEKLLCAIRDDLVVNELQAARRGGAIIPELQLYCALRYMGGGLHSDLFYFCGISRSAFHYVLWRVIFAILRCKPLRIRFPGTEEECAKAAKEFKSVSTGHAINNCVCVVDGYHMEIIVPQKMVAENVRSYYNGHYRTYGVNVQAACDRHCRFVFFGVAAPGVTPDRQAVNNVTLGDLIEGLQHFGKQSTAGSLPVEASVDDVARGFYCAIGDCAYTATNNFVPIFGGAQALLPENDNFNYFASQLRIRIEMAFGLLVEKFGVLQRALHIHLENVKYLALCLAMLHNYCINERLGEAIEFIHGEQMQQRSVAAVSQYEELSFQEYGQSSACRDYMVRRVKSKGLVRPMR